MAGTVNYEAYAPIEQKLADAYRGIRQSAAVTGSPVSDRTQKNLFAAKLGEAYRDQRARSAERWDKEKFKQTLDLRKSEYASDLDYRNRALAQQATLAQQGYGIQQQGINAQEDQALWGSIAAGAGTVVGVVGAALDWW